MWPVNESTALTFRTRSLWRQHLVLSMAAFGLTVAAVNFFSQNACQRSNAVKGSKAVAIVEYKPVEDQAMFPDAPIFNSSSNLKKIKTRILTPSFIGQALSDSFGVSPRPALTPGCPLGASPAMVEGSNFWTAAKNGDHSPASICGEQLFRGLSIRTGPGGATGENLITLELTLNQYPDADKIARALAERFVREYRAFWASEALKAYRDASSQADIAQQIHREALEMLQAFEDNVLRQEKSPPEQPSIRKSINNPPPKLPIIRPGSNSTANWRRCGNRKLRCWKIKRPCTRMSKIFAHGSPIFNNNQIPRRCLPRKPRHIIQSGRWISQPIQCVKWIPQFRLKHRPQ